MLRVDVTHIAETERDTRNGDSDSEERRRNGPAQALCPVEKLLARCYIPTDLKMHRQGTDEDPYRN